MARAFTQMNASELDGLRAALAATDGIMGDQPEFRRVRELACLTYDGAWTLVRHGADALVAWHAAGIHAWQASCMRAPTPAPCGWYAPELFA